MILALPVIIVILVFFALVALFDEDRLSFQSALVCLTVVVAVLWLLGLL